MVSVINDSERLVALGARQVFLAIRHLAVRPSFIFERDTTGRKQN
jgi:hypothetical protein